MAGVKTTVTRASTGSEKHSVIQFTDPVNGETGVSVMKDVTPFLPIKLAQKVNTATKDYPDEGDTVLDAVNNATPSVTLDASGVPTAPSLTGLLVLMLDGAAIGEYRTITAYNTSTRVATLDRVYASPPSAGDHYAILIDCARYDTLIIKSEFSTSSVDDLITISLALFGMNKNGAGTAIRPIRSQDFVRTLTNLAFQVDGQENIDSSTNYYQGLTIQVNVRGILGAKVRLLSIVGGGSISLWAGAV